jgi:hypothetical protein
MKEKLTSFDCKGPQKWSQAYAVPHGEGEDWRIVEEIPSPLWPPGAIE